MASPVAVHLLGAGTVRVLPILGDDGEMAQSVAFPTRLDMDRQLSGSCRLYPALDVRRAYRLEFCSDGTTPRQLNTASSGNSNVYTYVWAARKLDDSRKCVVKASYLVETPVKVRSAFDLLCEMEGDAERGVAFDEQSLVAIGRLVRVLCARVDPTDGMRAAKRAALAVMGGSPSRSASASAAAAAAVADDAGAEGPSPIQSSNCLVAGNNATAYFNKKCAAIALRLYTHLKQMATDYANWSRNVDSAFAPMRSMMRQLPPDAVSSLRMRARRYDNAANSEAINDVVAGGHASFLHVCGIAPALTPVVDYFTSSATDAGTSNVPGGRIIYSVTPYYKYSLVSLIRAPGLLDVSFDKPSLVNLAVVRSSLGQILATLSSAQHTARYVHYDLHASNIRCDKVRSGMPEHAKETWRYRVPVGDTVSDVIIPSTDSDGFVMRIIDHGRTRVDRPGLWSSDHGVAHLDSDRYNIRDAYDRSFDVRALAHDFVFYVINNWVDTMRRTAEQRDAIDTLPPMAAQVCREFVEFVDVLEAMASVSSWSDWTNGPHATTDGERSLPKPRTFMEYAGWVKRDMVDKPAVIRSNEFFVPRADTTDANIPSAILAMPFFASYIHDVDGDIPRTQLVANCMNGPAYIRSVLGEVILEGSEADSDDEQPAGTPVGRVGKRARPE